MPEGVRKSLSREEHAIRMQFESAEKGSDERNKFWKEMQKARRKGVQQKQRLFVKVRFKENISRIASCLVADLRIVSPDSAVVGGSHETRIDAYAPCELLFDSDLPACDRQGPCPHDVVVFVMEADNVRTVVRKRAWDALRELAGR